MFNHLIGQESIAALMQAAIERNRLAHAYLFHGPEGSGKRALAYDLARFLMCRADGARPCGICGDCAKTTRMDHPDFLWLLPTRTGGTDKQKQDDIQQAREAAPKDLYAPPLWSGTRMISIAQVRELQDRCAMRSFQGGWRIFVIQEVELLNVQSANALLKLLEEPPASVLFLLTSNQHDRLLPTVISRCVGVRFPGLPAAVIQDTLVRRYEASAGDAQVAAGLSGGSLTAALHHLDAGMQEKIAFANALAAGAFAPRNVPLPLEILEQIMQAGGAPVFRDVLRIILFWLRRITQANVAGPAPAEVPAMVLQHLRNSEFTHLRSMIAEVENSIDLVDRNVYIFLIGSVLLTHLRDIQNQHIPVD